ncbi:MAG: serine--tRNA ligase [Planctomycetaceae bacterium]|nr:serine--tRNA ligase [Planctomycetaceae bacterium]
MLDLQYICDHQDEVEANCQNRGVKVDLNRLVELADERRSLITEVGELRREQNEVSGSIRSASAEERPAIVERGKQLKVQVAEQESRLKVVEEEVADLQGQVPNLTHPEAPIGSEDEFTIVREWGKKPAFDFKPLDHVEIAAKLDIIDFEAGSRVAGHGFYYLKNEAVLLELALVQYAVQKVMSRGFTLFTTPDLARDEVLQGIGFLPRGPEAQIYSVENTDLSLVATAEITLGGMLKDQVVDVETLPLKVAGISHCFRTEAGAHGKATRGIYRVHQFTKVEMFAFTGPNSEDSESVHKEIVALEEEIFQGLGIPYRVIDTPTGDLGGPAYRKFDLEAWMPGRGENGEYGEVTSASNCTDYQARRLKIRCRSKESKGTQFVQTLNGTAISVARAMIAVLENNQQADGSVVIPEVLRPWVGKDVIAR